MLKISFFLAFSIGLLVLLQQGKNAKAYQILALYDLPDFEGVNVFLESYGPDLDVFNFSNKTSSVCFFSSIYILYDGINYNHDNLEVC